MRKPLFAGRFYPEDKGGLTDLVKECFTHPYGSGYTTSGTGRAKAIVTPHAGISVSGSVAAHAFHALEEGGHRDAYIIIGPDHYGQPYDIVTCSDNFQTPMGECETNTRIIDRLKQHIPDSRSAHAREHSIEVVLPFLQHIDPDAEIVPIIMGDQRMEAAQFLSEVIRDSTEDMDVAIIASSDLMHYVPDDTERTLDGEFISCVSELNVPAMYDCVYSYRLSICGYGPIATAMLASGAERAEILEHCNSWDTVHYDPDSVVGYFAAKFV